MGLTYTANIPLSVKVKDKEKQVAKGDKLPSGVDDRVIEALRKSGLLSVAGDEQAAAPAPPPDPETLPAERDTREVWEAYAPKVGVDPAEYSTEKKPVLVEAVTAAHEAKVKADAASTGDSGEGSGS
ncbi:MAG: hypothetical protein IE926_01885 [Micrococcales bacterium]|nr:hypothetical protein [Micrococcales bacterium]